ncbi:MAG: DUF2102 domain-containing protein [Thaumarchaeota archaeon]|nr:DUF2102 domain-containing protein [Nitrososphaerota archaeon]
MSTEKKTVRVVLSPNSESTPSSLWYRVFAELGDKVRVKEKAYGLLIKGPREFVDEIVEKLKESESGRVFVCESSQPIRSHSVFGGFLQLSGELTLLPFISVALEGGPREGASNVSAKLVRCKYIEEKNIVALLIDYGDGKVKVRCPDMMFRGSHLCGTMRRCPYGEILYP